MLLDSNKNTTLVSAGVVSPKVIYDFFEKHSAAETEADLNELLQGWLYQSLESVSAKVDIANKTFLITNISALLRVLQYSSSHLPSIGKLFDSYACESIIDRINELLSAFISPVENIDYSNNEAANMVDLVYLLNQMFFALEAEVMKGGLQCA